jgi:hypothetical protein
LKSLMTVPISLVGGRLAVPMVNTSEAWLPSQSASESLKGCRRPMGLQGHLRPVSLLGVFILLCLLGACGGDDAVDQQSDQQPSTSSVTGEAAPASDYASRQSPLLTPPSSTSDLARSPKDLPPLAARISAISPDRIDVTVRDPLPVSAATLIDPQGNRIAANRIDHDRLAYSGDSIGWPRIGVGVVGGSNSGVSTGFGIGLPLLPQTTEAAGSINESRFNFAIPDVAAYAAGWQHWKIHVDLSDGVNSRSFESLPPAPPAQ